MYNFLNILVFIVVLFFEGFTSNFSLKMISDTKKVRKVHKNDSKAKKYLDRLLSFTKGIVAVSMTLSIFMILTLYILLIRHSRIFDYVVLPVLMSLNLVLFIIKLVYITRYYNDDENESYEMILKDNYFYLLLTSVILNGLLFFILLGVFLLKVTNTTLSESFNKYILKPDM